ncbi:hypothetical protein THTE_3325 [Thermogutta terrifontis]|uniref:Uncharacterized protein n=1 Tax=Thermogutta terrifontis TaxID=1331910 RepID=A0A286RIZ2_9BACT|nr:hypothetical protein THTE_3325 [Thermogutta terrifontis]
MPNDSLVRIMVIAVLPCGFATKRRFLSTFGIPAHLSFFGPPHVVILT